MINRYVLGLLLFFMFGGLINSGQAQDDTLQVITVDNAAKLSQIGFVGEPVVNAVIPSPDETIVAVVSIQGVWLYQSDDLNNAFCIVPPLSNPSGNTIEVEFSHNSQKLALASSWALNNLNNRYNRVLLWDIASCSQQFLISDFDGGYPLVLDLAFDMNDHWLAAGLLDGQVMVWNTETGNKVATIQAFEWDAHAITFNNDSSLMAAWNIQASNTWSTHDWQPISEPLVMEDWPNLKPMADGDFEIISVPPQDPELLAQFQTSATYVSVDQLVLSPDETKLAIIGVGKVMLYDLSQSSHPAIQLIPGNYVGAHIEFSPDGQHLLTLAISDVTFAGVVRVWDSTTGEQEFQYEWRHPDTAETAADDATFSIDNQYVLTLHPDGNVRQWLVNGSPDQEERVIQNPNPNWHTGINAVTLNGKYLATTPGYSKTITIWNQNLQTMLGEITLEKTSGVAALAFSPDGSILAAGTYNGAVFLWDVATRNLITNFLAHQSVRSVSFGMAFSRDGKRLYTGGEDGVIRVWGVTD